MIQTVLEFESLYFEIYLVFEFCYLVFYIHDLLSYFLITVKPNVLF
jgi:hypothetical protein